MAFTVQPSQLAYLNDDMKWVIDQGDYQFSIGHSAGAIKLSGAATIRKTRYFEERDRVLFAQAAVTALTAK